MEGTTARIIRSFRKHKLGVFGLVVLAVLYLVILFAGFIAPYDFTQTHRNFVYAPPSRIRRAKTCAALNPVAYLYT